MKKEELNKKLKEKMGAAYRGENLDADVLREIMNIIRELYELDLVFLLTNRNYKYYLNQEVVSACDGIQVENREVVLTRKQYQELADNYISQPLSEEPIDSEREGFVGSVLHSGVMHQSEYFGSAGFWSKKARTWSEEEKNTLLALKHLALFYLSVDYMVRGITPYSTAKKEMADEKVLSGFYLNLKSGRCHTMKLVGFMADFVREWDDYAGLVESFADNQIEKSYGTLLKNDFELSKVRRSLSEENPSLHMDYPRKKNNKTDWIRFRIELIDLDRDGMPFNAIATFTDVTQEIRKKALLSQSASKDKQPYVVISAVDLRNGNYEVYVDNRDAKAEAAAHRDYKGFGEYSKLIEAITENNISPGYRERFLKRFSQEAMRSHFDSTSQMIQYDFPFDVNGEEFWVRLEAARSEKYSSREPKVLLYFSDVTRQKRREIQWQKRKEQLEKENELKKYQLEHDMLTGVYNRHGYKKILEEYKDEKIPIAYVMVDIDYFKAVNDNYGHAFGDAVLKRVASQMKETFRADDYVFRMGGDEFIVLLINCNKGAWDSISDKQHMMHIRMNQYFHKNFYVTLSMGISWSPSGVTEEMIALADEALYNTKNNGRAGLSVINSRHKIVYEWNDDMRAGVEENPLEQSGTGAYRLEFPHGKLQNGRLVCNEITRSLMGLSDKMSPEECFKTWMSRIDENFKGIVEKTRDELVANGQAECTYAYNHPTKGRIMVRSGGKSVDNEDGIVFYGYHQSIQGTSIVLQQDDTQKLIAAMNSLYFCSYFIDIIGDSYYTFKATVEAGELEAQEGRASAGIRRFVEALVSEEQREYMFEFTDLSTLAERMTGKPFIEKEYLSVTEQGWRRARFIPVDYDLKGNVTHVQFVIGSIDKSKRAEIERENQMRDGMLLQVQIGQAISKSKVMQAGLMDKKSGEVTTWNPLDFSEKFGAYSFEEVKHKNQKYLLEEELTLFNSEYNLDEICRRVEQEGECTFNYRMRSSDGEYIMTAIHFEECAIDSNKLLAVSEDISDARIDQLQGMLTDEQKLMSCVQQLIIIDDTQGALNYLMDQIIDYYRCDRACLSILIGEHQGKLVKERCSSGIAPKFNEGDELMLSDFMQWEEIRSPIRLKKVFCEGDENEEQRWMKEAGLENLMILSFELGSDQVGYISIDNLKQHEEDTNWIGTLAFFVANELQKL